jgi:hypothetical protein
MKVVCVTPAGRRATLSILKTYMDKLYTLGVINEWHLWFNVKNDDDREYVLSLENDYTKIIRLFDKEEPGFGTASVISRFFSYCNDPYTVYVRLDDDIVYIDIDGFKRFIQFRIADTTHFMVYPLIINNIFTSAFLQKNGVLRYPQSSDILERWKKILSQVNVEDIRSRDVSTIRMHHYFPGSSFLDPLYWGDTQFCEFLHRSFIENIKSQTIPSMYIPNTELSNFECISIQAISWRGEDMTGIPNLDEEGWIGFFYPLLNKKPNILYGSCTVAHYSYYNQLPHLNTTDILESYRAFT